MSKKTSSKNWYQVHKARSGNESIEKSLEVAQARQNFQAQNSIVQNMQEGNQGSLVSDVRRLFFGRNKQEDQIYQAEMTLKDAKAKLDVAVSEARSKGERAYSADWASRNISEKN